MGAYCFPLPEKVMSVCQNHDNNSQKGKGSCLEAFWKEKWLALLLTHAIYKEEPEKVINLVGEKVKQSTQSDCLARLTLDISSFISHEGE